ncbi:MAG: hypothetical protein K0V04_18535 [Deltaproteobacteria bacterium]|nr:hypothetical protein [Deltaproteobacteria bacterium]
MAWSVAESIPGEGRRRRPPTAPLQRLPPQALRGATTLEQLALPVLIIGCFVALALVQLILAW